MSADGAKKESASAITARLTSIEEKFASNHSEVTMTMNEILKELKALQVQFKSIETKKSTKSAGGATKAGTRAVTSTFPANTAGYFRKEWANASDKSEFLAQFDIDASTVTKMEKAVAKEAADLEGEALNNAQANWFIKSYFVGPTADKDMKDKLDKMYKSAKDEYERTAKAEAAAKAAEEAELEPKKAEKKTKTPTKKAAAKPAKDEDDDE